MNLPKVKRRRVRAGDLKPSVYNPRNISEEALEGLQHSLSEFGLLQAIIVNEREDGELRVVGGHQRMRAVNPDPDDKLDVVIVHLSDAREKALNLALNSGAISGTWTENLKVVLDEVRAELPDLSADLRLPELELDVPLFDDGQANDAAREWTGMPEYEHEDQTSFRRIIVHFKCQEDVDRFAKLVEQNLTERTQSIWFPQAEIETYADKRYAE